jgi:ABC-type multidrug transport system fused ATPase/permease subunit
MQTLKKLLFLLTSKERKEASLLIVMIIIMVFIDMVGVASILPFMAVLTNPSLIETNIILNNLFQVSKIFGVENSKEFLFVSGLFLFLILIISLFLKAITSYAQQRFIKMREYSIGKRLIAGYLHQPYSWFLGRHSADLGKTILSEVEVVSGFGIAPLLELIAKCLATFSLIILLIVVNPKLAITVGLTLSLTYLVIFFFLKGRLKRIGKERLKNNELRFTAVSEAFGASKEVKVGGLEKFYIKLFSDPAKNFARTQASYFAIALLPRYILEALAFGGILLITLFLMIDSGSFDKSLPIISLYVFAGYRLMPALQQIYSSFTDLAVVGPSLNKLFDDLKNLNLPNYDQDDKILSLNKSIVLNDVNYSYPNSSKISLKNINIEISAKSTIGLVGATGSGKTTTVDIILGLLEAQKGFLEIDGQVVNQKNVRSWQRLIGYVPQHIYLSDDSILSNIAFGLDVDEIDQEAVEKASKIANLHNFVVEKLDNQYQTVVGERGVRLSGGERQRIGIARALYHNPQVLILDEATSALDNQTEKAVIEALSNLRKNITIILIAHRLNTVKNCDVIFKLENGSLIEKGTFNELFEK